MNIRMIGIDYNRASIADRELFSLTQTYAARTAQAFVEQGLCAGCVVLSTCNRTEIWLSACREDVRPVDVFCRMKQVEPAEYTAYFQERSSEEAVRYLFSLACGLESQIFGEDQILTQVKQALTLAREHQCADAVLEVLFRHAVTCAKRVKSSVRLTAQNASVPARATALLEEQLGCLTGKRCLVIGNGEIGRLCARCLVDKGCAVRMTLRQYKRQDVVIPMGVDILPYEERFSVLGQMDVVVSATLSPHYTLSLEQVRDALHGRSVVLVDLAVPRDIDPAIGELESVTLYDMDKLGLKMDTAKLPAVQKANLLIEEYVADFEHWYYFKDYVKSVKRIGKLIGKETRGKLKPTFKAMALDEVEHAQLQKAVEKASAKAVTKLLYGLKETLEQDKWEECIRALEHSAEQIQK